MKVEAQAIPKLSYGAITDQGKVREENEDCMFVEAWPDGRALLVVLADGMGGQAGGRVASEIVAETFRTLLAQPVPDDKFERYERLLGCFYTAEEAIKKRASTEFALLNMGATAIAAILTPLDCLFLYAGDCRFYHFRKESETYVTADHSVTRMLVETGRLASADAADHPMRSVVTSSLSASPKGRLHVDPKWNETSDQQAAYRNLLPGDLLLFCTDGLSNEVPRGVLNSIMGDDETEATALARILVDTALEAGGKDNVTVVVVGVSPSLALRDDGPACVGQDGLDVKE